MISVGFLFLTFFIGICSIFMCLREKKGSSICPKSVLYEQAEELSVPKSRRVPKMIPVVIRKEGRQTYWDSIYFLAVCVMAEAEGESELGKRLVIDTVLNRAAHPDFPDTVWEVISHPNAFTSYWDGRMDKAEPAQEIYRLISEELCNQTNEEVLYFRAGDWPEYGTPLIQEGEHYFSG